MHFQMLPTSNNLDFQKRRYTYKYFMIFKKMSFKPGNGTIYGQEIDDGGNRSLLQHRSTAECRRGNLKAYLADTMNCGGPPMDYSVFYAP